MNKHPEQWTFIAIDPGILIPVFHNIDQDISRLTILHFDQIRHFGALIEHIKNGDDKIPDKPKSRRRKKSRSRPMTEYEMTQKVT